MAMWLLWIFSLAVSFLLPAIGEVMSSFKPCDQFFLDGKDPKLVPMNPARICQLYRNKYQFATMYDRDLRIPLFSAYKYQLGEGNREMDWMIEPQLALPGDSQRRSMEPEGTCQINPLLLAKSQAVGGDYVSAINYGKGQLAPASHHQYDSKAATYTLTNTVPQYQELMNGEWDDFLRSMSQSTIGCHETYVIVGVVPGDDYISGDRVNKPSHIWAAVCCVSNRGQKQSWGVIAENNQNKVENFSLQKLESELSRKYGKGGIDLFNGDCY